MILIAPYARRLRNGKENPKNYPYWPHLVELLEEDGEVVVQVGITGEPQLVGNQVFNRPISDLIHLLKECRTWISVDSFFQHLAWDNGKPGIVLWGQSDPLIFGHPENVNLLKSRLMLRTNQFLTWEQCDYNPDVFVQPDIVIDTLVREFP